MTLVEMLDRNARKFPHKDCLRYSGQSLTFAALKEKAEQAAGFLQSRGVQKGDTIAIMSFNTPAFVIAFFGALKAGAAVVPVNHKLAAPEVDYILAHSEARFFYLMVPLTESPKILRFQLKCLPLIPVLMALNAWRRPWKIAQPSSLWI